MTSWIKCSERIPKPGSISLITNGKAYSLGWTDTCRGTYVFMDMNMRHQIKGITHWAELPPLPEVPKDE
jgi:hypothetical protein